MKTFNCISFVFILTFLFSTCLFAHPQTDSIQRKFVVVLDAGHGGHDPGNVNNGFREKNIALKVVLATGKALERYNNIKVIYTRKTDVFVTLKGRAEKANHAKADVFVSVHCNSFKRNGAHGPETFVLGLWDNKRNLAIAKKENSVITLEKNYKVTYNGFDPNSDASYIGLQLMQEEALGQSILLADLVQKQFTNSLHRYDRGVKQAGFLVLRETVMPSVLVETGFLTNINEGRYLNSKHGQNEMGAAIAKGIVGYKNNLNLDASRVKRNGKDIKNKKELYKNIVFRVQLAAGSTPLETAPYNFNGLKGIERKKEGELYKYYYGKTSDYLEIQNMQRDAQEKGYTSSYIVAFENDKKITVDEALKSKAK